MAFKIINPAWKAPVTQKAEQHKAAVLSHLQDNAGKRTFTLAELRAALPAIAGDLSRTVVAEIARQIGAEVDGADSDDA